jgi:hypothetical protein
MAARKQVTDKRTQLERFKDMAKEVEADESPDALDRAFSRIDPHKKAPPLPKRKSRSSSLGRDKKIKV